MFFYQITSFEFIYINTVASYCVVRGSKKIGVGEGKGDSSSQEIFLNFFQLFVGFLPYFCVV